MNRKIIFSFFISRSMGADTENFTYDIADRLTGWTIINSTSYSANYSSNGNIVRKSDFGMYAYSSSKPHAVSGISSLFAGDSTIGLQLRYFRRKAKEF